MLLRQIFDPYLAQYAYLIGCQKTGEALIIDPERDIDRYTTLAAENNLRITAVAETHIHADFVSGAREFAQDHNIHLYLSNEGGPEWSYAWPVGRANVHLLKDGDSFKVGNIHIEAIHTPGHTPEHLCFLITDLGAGADAPIALATGDFLFVGDVGRPDLLESAAGVKNVMEPSARELQRSLTSRLAPYEDYLQILPAHGAGSACGKSLGAIPMTTLGYERRFNSALKLAQQDAEGFVKDILTGQPDPPLYFATMKRVNRDGVPVTGGISTPPKINPSELATKVRGEGVVVLDTRSDPTAFNACHLKGAVSAPLHSSFFSNAAGSFLNPDDTVILIVENTDDVDLAVRQLYRIGFDTIAGWISSTEIEASSATCEETPRVAFSSFDPASARSEGEIIDVRTTAEYNESHLEGAHSLPYTRLKEHLASIPARKKLFVHCASGKRASLATSFLRSRGFDAIHVDGAYSQCGTGLSRK